MQDERADLLFPSFAASPNHSPQRAQQKTLNRSVTKITIELPESLVESTLDENSCCESEVNEKEEEQGKNIRVFCRFRPAKQHAGFKHDATMVDDGQNRYSFDAIFGQQSRQGQVFAAVGGRHIDAFFRGQNSTIFTYGQTGSGKTFTMFGQLRDRELFGIIPRALEQVFRRKGGEELTCSILQIYNEKLIDLFDPLKQGEGVRIKEAAESVALEGLVEVRVESLQEVMELIRFGYRDRKIATTHNNDCSSRSHTILFLHRTHACNDRTFRNKLCFIDLAGSEKIRKSGVSGQTLQQAKKINLSLSCLGNVVSALTTSAEHVPYRNSKLTRILRDSLNGYSRTSIITTCSSDKHDAPETLSTIRFAVRAKRIKNKKRLENIALSSEQVIASLKKELAVTRKELEYYKLREGEAVEPEEIPEEAVVCRPVYGSQFSGVASRIAKRSLAESVQE